MAEGIPYYVILDANVWIAERLLQSSLGSATLFNLTRSHALIGLPEIVEIEVKSVLTQQAEKAAEDLRKNARLLRQLSGQRAWHVVPTSEAVQEGMQQRWAELCGILRPLPLSLEQARAALKRVTEKIPPSGVNNEQFRDCRIWEAAIDLSAEGTVHLITNDSAFYEGRDRPRGLLAETLREETERAGRELRVYPSLQVFLEKMDTAVVALEGAGISEVIVRAAMPRAAEIVATNASDYELGRAGRTRINGYATPKPSVIAVSFQTSFDLQPVEAPNGGASEVGGTMTVGGSCSYDPNQDGVSDIEITEWWTSLQRGRLSSGTHHVSSDTYHSGAKYSEGKTRIITDF
ncbi:MAG: PIN domain-containing protein [Candidatus Binataceae bacterium]